MRIDATEVALQSLLSGSKTLTIPDFQRNYAWKSEQIDAFMDDVLDLTITEDEHFFGPIVLLDATKDTLSVIDGQQRLTTTIMLLCLIRDQIESFADDYVVVGDNRISLNQFIFQMLKHDDLSKDRYEANYQIRHVFKTHVLASLNNVNRKNFSPRATGMTAAEKLATAELRTSYLRMQKRLNSWLLPNAGDERAMKEQVYNLIKALRSGFRILEIKMYSEDDAYTLFETLNERGLRLTPSDLLKSFTLRKAKEDSPEQINDVLIRWDNTVGQLGDFPFTKFLRHYLLSIQTDKVQAKKIFSFFNKLVDSYGAKGSIKNLEMLEKAADVYAKLLGENANFGDAKLDDTISRINLFSETHRVFLLRVMLGKYSIAAKRRAAHATELIAFRWILTGGNAQELETHYQNAANSLIGPKGDMLDSDDALSSAVSNLLTKLPTDGAVRSHIIENPARKELQYYAFRKINYGVTHVELSWPQQSIHVEHLAPQRPDPNSNWYERVAAKSLSDPNLPNYDDFVAKWGNLSLLEFEINTSIGNSEWGVKVYGRPAETQRGLQDSTIKMTKDVAKVKEWTAATIDSRTIWVADAMVELTNMNVLDSNTPSITGFSN